MAGRGVTIGVSFEAGRARHLAGTALALLMAGVTLMPLAASAQENSGAAIATERAGNGTGQPVAAFDPGRAGMTSAGQGAALLAALGHDPAPFDINDTRPKTEAPANPAPASAAPADPVTPAPSVGNGAPETGTGTATPAPVTPAAATPAAPATGTSTPATVSAPQAPRPDAGVSERLTALVTDRLSRYAQRPAEQQALAAFYAARNFQPMFVAQGMVTPLGLAALGAFTGAAAEGLNPADYTVPPLPARPDEAALADYELRLAATTLVYARHVQSGRFDPKRISKDVDPSPSVPDPLDVLATVSAAENAGKAYASFAPYYDEYRLLKTQLGRRLAEGAGVVHAPIPAGPSIRPGDRDPRVPLLRARLGIGGAPDDVVYDAYLMEAVRDFQRLAGANPDGIVGRGTLAVLNEGAGDSLDDIIANMERWRWLPHQVAPTYVIVNIPEYMVRIVVNEQTIHETRVVVGKPENQTPLMSEQMQYAVFNPSWNVPPGIIKNEMLPKLQADPYALDRQGIDVVRNGRIIDPGTVDWSRGSQGYAFRQAPGERNALGRMKFMFPNKHSVYLHDTPSRALFARDRRAFSHGCVRVFEPLKFAEVLFSVGLPGDGWSQQRINSLIGGDEKYLNLKQRFPVHLVYFTTYVDAEGQLVSREDIYGINDATKAMLGLNGTRVADRGGVVAPR
ncbi:L,D-transpeptidase family protein [Ancylobacter sp. SL191]|uniref:L,D-transpeptidase family protein n=1 Tax=Ancylobacter sp. SL191 TaxID=2995166 RepID=UPI00226E3FC9|nr:L,D-transpeptidase family protein [Ancylobacter sp. SL191]WAC28868.1 L,D-transpeptidase family protein [Ancylobacter sp. SL191]